MTLRYNRANGFRLTGLGIRLLSLTPSFNSFLFPAVPNSILLQVSVEDAILDDLGANILDDLGSDIVGPIPAATANGARLFELSPV